MNIMPAVCLLCAGPLAAGVITGQVAGLGAGSGNVSFVMVDEESSFTLTLLGGEVDAPPTGVASGILNVGVHWFVELVITLSSRVPPVGSPVAQRELVSVSGTIQHFTQPHPDRDQGLGELITIDTSLAPSGPDQFMPNFTLALFGHGLDKDIVTQAGTSTPDRQLGGGHIGSWTVAIQGVHTPEPGAAWLVLSGLAVLAVLRLARRGLAAFLLVLPGLWAGPILPPPPLPLQPVAGLPNVGYFFQENEESFVLFLVGGPVQLPGAPTSVNAPLVAGADWSVALTITLSDNNTPSRQVPGAVDITASITHQAQPHPGMDGGPGPTVLVQDTGRGNGPNLIVTFVGGPVTRTLNQTFFAVAHGSHWDEYTQSSTWNINAPPDNTSQITDWTLAITGHHTPEPGTAYLLAAGCAVVWRLRVRRTSRP
ncbi:MAG: hypothetical protein FJW39_04175 [Acidobacteria bacterium]|nr:hypothetical protein [Acidobacteriota bacterium]